jgi:hypothetical protein
MAAAISLLGMPNSVLEGLESQTPPDSQVLKFHLVFHKAAKAA